MTPDAAVAAAQEALARNDRDFASQLYESAARSVIEVNQEQAAQLYRLAFMYADPHDLRKDKLGAAAQGIFERIGSHDGIADTLILRANAAAERGQLHLSYKLHLEATKVLSELIARTIAPVLEDGAQNDDLVASLRPLGEKISFCLQQLTELEGEKE